MEKTNTQNRARGCRKLEIWNSLECRLRVYIRSFSGLTEEDMEDVLVAVMHSFWISGPDIVDAARPWLYKTARNAAIDVRRRNMRIFGRRADVNRDVIYSIAACPEESPEARLLSDEETAFVRAFLRSLSGAERECAFFAYAEGLTCGEIAELTKSPVGTVKWRLSLIKRKFMRRYRRIML